MKNLVRMRTSLKEEVEAILNDQIKMEFEASNKYLAIASWCDRNGYKNSAHYFFTQATEEHTHMMKIFRFILNLGGTSVTPDVEKQKQEYSSIRECFETALESEIKVTTAISKIVAAARQVNDYATEQLALWFINEQIEEEYNARRALEIIDLMEGESLFAIDQELGSIRESAAQSMTNGTAE
ncbi:ferritin [Emticicia sp. CRIBPO]|jgi:ferritin|uniref:ferritin n=1 Tax=Emticicia sp. CRIBPO TaxID=2683258 RepID=UPI001411B569|nr:ferritin [Emticicia sp. CRIBPO]NBA85160.1 ferritin [Emticicia sp. CRIBPO]